MKPLPITLTAIVLLCIAWAAHGLSDALAEHSRLKSENSALAEALETAKESRNEAWKQVQQARSTAGALGAFEEGGE